LVSIEDSGTRKVGRTGFSVVRRRCASAKVGRKVSELVRGRSAIPRWLGPAYILLDVVTWSPMRTIGVRSKMSEEALRIISEGVEVRSSNHALTGKRIHLILLIYTPI
jgi:hypothetical protein